MYQRLSNLPNGRNILVATTLYLEEKLIIYEREHTSDVYFRHVAKSAKNHYCMVVKVAFKEKSLDKTNVDSSFLFLGKFSVSAKGTRDV